MELAETAFVTDGSCSRPKKGEQEHVMATEQSQAPGLVEACVGATIWLPIVARDGLTSTCPGMTEFVTPSAGVAIPLFGRVPHRVP